MISPAGPSSWGTARGTTDELEVGVSLSIYIKCSPYSQNSSGLYENLQSIRQIVEHTASLLNVANLFQHGISDVF